MSEDEIKESKLYKDLENNRDYYKQEWQLIGRELEKKNKIIKSQTLEIAKKDDIIQELKNEIKANGVKRNE